MQQDALHSLHTRLSTDWVPHLETLPRHIHPVKTSILTCSQDSVPPCLPEQLLLPALAKLALRPHSRRIRWARHRHQPLRAELW